MILSCEENCEKYIDVNHKVKKKDGLIFVKIFPANNIGNTS